VNRVRVVPRKRRREAASSQSASRDKFLATKVIAESITPAHPELLKQLERKRTVEKILNGLGSDASALPKDSWESGQLRYFLRGKYAQVPYADLSPEQFNDQLDRLAKKRHEARKRDEYKADVPAWLAYAIVFGLIFLILKLIR
jgi:hypothetical protein